MKRQKKHRMLLNNTYGSRYSHHYSKFPGCFYCGDIAGTIDHCPPISFCDVTDARWFREQKINFYTVQCCEHCNNGLSNRALFTLQERAQYILRRLEIEAEKFVIWTEDEMEEMSPMFRRMIRAKKMQHKALLERVRFCQHLIFRNEDFPEEK